MIRSTLALALCAAAFAAHAASSSASVAGPVFKLFDLDTGDGIAPEIHPYGQPGDPPDFDLLTSGLRRPGSVQMTTGAATVTSTVSARSQSGSFGGFTSGASASYGLFSDGIYGAYTVTPHTQLTVTLPYTLAWNAGIGGFATAGLDMSAQLVGPPTTLTGRAAAAHSSAPGDLFGRIVSGLKLTLQNNEATSGVFAYATQLFAQGRSAAAACMRSALH
jgi:hypothetical protein